MEYSLRDISRKLRGTIQVSNLGMFRYIRYYLAAPVDMIPTSCVVTSTGRKLLLRECFVYLSLLCWERFGTYSLQAPRPLSC